jgi:hypothetical protein
MSVAFLLFAMSLWLLVAGVSVEDAPVRAPVRASFRASSGRARGAGPRRSTRRR